MKSRLWLKATLVVAAIIGYPIAMHVLLTSGQWPASTLAMGLLPLALVALGLAKTGHLKSAVLLVALLCALTGYFWHTLLQRQDLVYLLESAGMDTMMAWVFGRTLLPSREPLISQFARRIHGAGFTPAIATYTRQATWAWTLFFLTLAASSILLFFVAPLATWSFFVNGLSLPLLIVMFILEYAARRVILRDVQHLSITQGASMFWDKRTPADGKS